MEFWSGSLDTWCSTISQRKGQREGGQRQETNQCLAKGVAAQRQCEPRSSWSQVVLQFDLGKCDQAAHGAQCRNGFHLCCRKGCFAPHPVPEHQDGKKNWRFERISKLVADGARLEDCIVIEILLDLVVLRPAWSSSVTLAIVGSGECRSHLLGATMWECVTSSSDSFETHPWKEFAWSAAA